MPNTANDSGFKTFTAGEAISKGIYVKRSGSNVVSCDADEASIGVAYNGVAASGDVITVKLFTAPGTMLVLSGAAIADNASVYTDADGKGTSTGTTNVLGTALEAASAADELIEVLPNV